MFTVSMLEPMTKSATDSAEAGAPLQPRVRDLGSEAAHKEIGARLRTARREKGLTLRELAVDVGVSASAISQIETGRSKASVDTLYAMVDRLGISLDSLFDKDADQPAVPATAPMPSGGLICHPDQRQVIDLETGVQWQLLTQSADPSVDFLYVIYEVGGASSANGVFVRHPGREYGLIQSGRLRVSLGFEVHELGPGDSISFDSTTPHRLENIGDEPVHAVWFSMGRNHHTGESH